MLRVVPRDSRNCPTAVFTSCIHICVTAWRFVFRTGSQLNVGINYKLNCLKLPPQGQDTGGQIFVSSDSLHMTVKPSERTEQSRLHLQLANKRS